VKIQSNKEPHRVTSALNCYKGLESKIRKENPDLNELAPPYKKARRNFNKATASNRARNCDPRNIPGFG
jgi:hypothetical protein